MAIYGTLATDNILNIDASIADTAEDVFVYDTRKDSDGGAWRKRTQSTSWYNETLGTANRGTRREFPSVAVIVISTDQIFGDTLTIYDGDDPDLPMWMVFNSRNTDAWIAGWRASISTASVTIYLTCGTAVSALNGKICVSHDDATGGVNYASGHGIQILDFLTEKSQVLGSNSYSTATSLSPFVNRNSVSSMHYRTVDDLTSQVIANVSVNDVAMTVLPNAPIDPSTGLPIPTIAVATKSGVSVIRDDGNVYDIAYGTRSTISVSFNKSNNLNFLFVDNNVQFVNVPVPNRDYSSGTGAVLVSLTGGSGYHITSLFSSNTQSVILGGNVLDTLPNASSGTSGLTFISNETPTGYLQGAVAYATTSYNTGWMHGDIKGAFLSDTTTGTLSTTDLELITNGDFSNGTTGWSNDATEIFTVSSGVASVDRNGGGSTGQCYQTITTEVGRTYTVGVQVTALSNGFQVYKDESSDEMSQGAVNATGTHYWTFTATTTTTRLDFSATQSVSATASFDDITIFDGVADRSVNNKGLQVFGTVTKSAVATGAELVGYSGFSASNYLRQPYNSNLDFGSNDFSVVYWFNQTTHSSYQDVVNRTDSGQNNGSWLIQHINNGSIQFYVRTSGSYTTYLSSGSNLITNYGWTQIVVTRTSGAYAMYFNGRQVANGTGTTSLTVNGAELQISGRKSTNVYPILTGNSIALARVSASVPSPEQIKKMYEDEKCLFQENAKATLYGSSDAVTALAYDSTTSLLHVGTSGGRSTFSGLKRVENTTTAVATAISASNGLVAEQ